MRDFGNACCLPVAPFFYAPAQIIVMDSQNLRSQKPGIYGSRVSDSQCTNRNSCGHLDY
jgi:hypothetical protein